MLTNEGLELLEDEQCWELLAGGVVGRVAVTTGAVPVIMPVNYVVLDRGIVFRTSAGAKLSAARRSAVVAFEVDEYDRAERTGWSVNVLGRAEEVHDLGVTLRAIAAGLEPFADGVRAKIVRIRPQLVTGRRIVHDASAPRSAGPQPAL